MSKPSNRYFTILLVPHSEKCSYSLRLPNFIVKLLLIFLVSFLAVLVFFSYNYHEMTVENSRLKEVKEVNIEKRKKIEEFAKKTQELEKEFALLAKTEHKVRELADLDDEEAYEDLLKTLESQGGQRGEDIKSNQGSNLETTQENIRSLKTRIPKQKEMLEETKKSLEEKEEKRQHTPDLWPVEGRVSSPFGYRSSPLTGIREFHQGIDIAASYKTPVRAAADGTVTYASYRGGSGKLVIIDHGYGYETHYAHLSSFDVDNGEVIEKGEVIGYVGSTGSSTGPHLHYEIHVNNEPIDPKDYLQ